MGYRFFAGYTCLIVTTYERKIVYKHYVESKILSKHTNHGHRTQYHVVLTDAEGNKDFLWMADADYIDWIEDPIVLTGKSFSFDAETYRPFA